jgi:hypothetical protein
VSAALVAAVAAVSVAGSADLDAPPRFDGAGYAVLGEALATGRGYREIDRPGEPRHAHFPPGYPAALAGLWRFTGRSARAAHLLSALCTVAAAVAAWRWFRGIYPPRVALVMGLALAVNWTWGRTGAAFQSEPLYLLLGQLAVLAAVRASRRGGFGWGVVLGILMAACFLTRHVGACLALSAGLDLIARGRRAKAFTAWAVAAALALPWVGWLAAAPGGTQARLLTEGGLPARVARQSLFYAQRLPDLLTGPVVETGTVFRRSPKVAAAANAWALAATVVLGYGWARTLRSRRRRLAGLIALTTLGLLLVWPFTEAGRFLIPLVPVVLVGAVEGLAPFAARLGLRRPRAWAAWAVLAASIPYAGYALATGRAEAQRRTHQDFDAACAWLARHDEPPGLVLSRHPGEVFWQTGRQGLSAESDDPEEVARAVDRLGVAYLLIDVERYAGAPASPLARFVERHPERVEKVWGRESGRSATAVYRVRSGEPPGPSK